MSDDEDLYPPDLEVLTPSARAARKRAAAGTFLITLGLGLFLQRLLNRDLDFFWLAVGLALIAAWVQAPQFWLFAMGAIFTGIAAGDLLESLVSLPFETTVSCLSAAGGFFAVFVRYPHRAKWAIVPAGILGVIGVLAGAVELIGFVPAILGAFGIPTLLIAGGVLLLFRRTLPPKAVKIGLVIVGIMLITSAVSTVDSWDGSRIAPRFGDDHSFLDANRSELPLPDLDGRTLFVEADDEGAVMLTTAPFGAGSAAARTSRAFPGRIAVDEDEDRVTLVYRARSSAPMFGRGGTVSWEVVVPAGSKVEVETDEGPITAVLGDGTYDLRSDDGRVEVVLQETGAAVSATTDDGDIFVDGAPVDSTFSTPEAAGATTRVDIETEDGAITITGLKAA